MKKILRPTPNILTVIRIIGAVSLVFLDLGSIPFLVVYAVAGITDVLDGHLARKYHLESEIGNVLDTSADWLLLSVMAVKFIPYLINILEWWNWVIILVPFVIHAIAYLVCYLKFKKLSALHTYLNKIMSAAIFVYPFTFIGEIYWLYNSYEIFFGLIAFLGSIEVNLIHLLSNEYDNRNKSIFILLKNRKCEQK